MDFLETPPSWLLEAASVFIDVAVKAAGLGLLALLIDRLLGRGRELARCTVWNVCLIALAILPIAAAALPRLRVPCLPGAAPPAGGETFSAATGPPLIAAAVPVRAPRPAAGDALRGDLAPELPAISARVPAGPSAWEGPPATSPPVGAAAAPAPPRRARPHWLWAAAILYASAAGILALRLCRSLLSARRLDRRSRRVEDALWKRGLERWRRALGIRRRVRLLESGDLAVPVALGWLSPAVVIPSSLRVRSRRDLRDAILIHELAHVRRQDYPWQILLAVLKVLYCFHPALWLAERRLAALREEVCDAVSVHALRSPERYRRSLLEVAGALVRRPAAIPGLAMARPNRLARRLERIAAGASLPFCLARLPARLAIGTLLIAAAWLAGVVEPARLRAAGGSGDGGPGAGNAASTAGSLTVNVLDARSREPIEGAEVAIDLGGPPRRERTGAAGVLRIMLPAEPPATLSLRVFKEGFVPAEKGWRLRGFDRDALPASQEFELEPGIAIGGRVEDGEGRPIAGASVRIFALGKADDGWPATAAYPAVADGEGMWRSNIVPAAFKNLTLQFTHPEYFESSLSIRGPEHPDFAALRAGNLAQILERGLRIEGEVVDREGRPVSGARVFHSLEQGALAADSRSAVSGSDGRFAAHGIRPGGGSLAVTADGFAPAQAEFIAAAGMAPLRIELDRGRPLRFRVRDRDGKPVSEAAVHVGVWGRLQPWIWTFRTDADGRCEWPHAPSEKIEVNVVREGYLGIRDCEIDPRIAERDFVLDPALVIRGRVVDASSRMPVREFRVVRGIDRGEGYAAQWSAAGARSFTGGEFAVQIDERWQAVLLRIEAPGYRPQATRRFRIDEGEQSVEMALEPEAGPRGAVLDAEGRPVEGAEVALAAGGHRVQVHNGILDDRDCPRAVAGPEGRFEFASQLAEFTAIALHERGFAIVSGKELAATGKAILQPWGRVEGRLLEGGKPVAGESVALKHDNAAGPLRAISPRYETRSGADGRFVLERVFPGEAIAGRIVLVGKPGEVVFRDRFGASAHVEVAGGRAARIEIGGRGAAVAGRLLPPPGREAETDWERAFVRLDRKAEPLPRQRPRGREGQEEWARWYARWWSSEEGKAHRRAEWSAWAAAGGGAFRFEGVPPGAYTLRIALHGPPRMMHGIQGPGRPIGTLSRDLEVLIGQDGKPAAVDLGTLALEESRVLEVGDIAPGFVFRTLAGEELKLESFRGKYVLLDFWATWCGPCLREMPDLRAVHEALGKDEAFAMIGLSLDAGPEAPRDFAEKHGLGWTQGFLGEDSEAARVYQVNSIPAAFLIAPDGRLAARDLGGPGLLERIRGTIQAGKR